MDSVDGFDFKLIHEQISNEGAYEGNPWHCTMDLFIIFTLEEEVCIFEAELQKGDYLRDRTCWSFGNSRWILL